MENDKRALTEKFEEFFGRNGDRWFLQSWVDAVHGPDIVEEIGDTKDKIVVEDVESVSKNIIVALSHHKDARGAGKYSEGTGGQLVADVMDSVVRDIELLAYSDSSGGASEESLDGVADWGEENTSQEKLSKACQDPRLVNAGIKHFGF